MYKIVDQMDTGKKFKGYPLQDFVIENDQGERRICREMIMVVVENLTKEHWNKLEPMLKAGMNCPFDDPNHTIGPNEPCPICGDLNDWGADADGNPTNSNCVNYRKNSMTKDLIAVVRHYSNKIENNRTPQDIYESLREEVTELEAEVFNYGDGKDGVAGEAIDVILCALDLIYKNNPEWTNEDIVAYAEKKCQKWAQKYSKANE